MKQELDEALCKDFPELYAQRHADMGTTCMCWGFECGDGWEPLIRQLSQQLSILPIGIQAVQVKEKFGSLRFYETTVNSKQFPIEKYVIWVDIAASCIAAACNRSNHTCEECGKYGKIENNQGWLKCLCEKHADSYKRAEDYILGDISD